MSVRLVLHDDLSVDLFYEDGLVWDQRLVPELAMHCHGQLLYLAEHPGTAGDVAWQAISDEVHNPAAAVCREPLSADDAQRFYARLYELLGGYG